MSDTTSCALANAVGDFLRLGMNGRMSLVTVLELDSGFKELVIRWCEEKLPALEIWQNHWWKFLYSGAYRLILRWLFLFVQWYASVQRRRRRKQRGDLDTQTVIEGISEWKERAEESDGKDETERLDL